MLTKLNILIYALTQWTSFVRVILMTYLTSSDGILQKSILSTLPGLKRAGSIKSGRLLAANT